MATYLHTFRHLVAWLSNLESKHMTLRWIMRSPSKFAATACAVLIAIGCGGCKPINGTDTSSSNETAETNIVAQQALAGVGKEGQSLKDNTGVSRIISGPAQALFNFKQKAVLEIQVKQAIDVFRATEGRFPNSHKEFMDRCIAPYNIQLPELPEGAVYHFNSQEGQLWVYPKDEVPAD